MKTQKFVSYASLAVCAMAVLATAQAAPSLKSVTLGNQSPTPAAPGGKGMFPVTVTRAGTGSMSVYLSVSGLPPAATASFVPPKVSFSDQGPSTKNAVLVIALDPNTIAGDYPITMTARHGASPSALTVSSLLTVGASTVPLFPPVLYPPVLNPDGTIGLSGQGTSSQPVLVQATTNLLSASSWETIGVYMLDQTGLFSVIDQDATNFPVRFYRAAQ